MKRLLVAFMVVLGVVQSVRSQESALDFFVEAVVDNSTPFVGQQVTYTFRLYHAVDLENLLFQPSAFDGFSRVSGDAGSGGGLAFNRSYAAVVEGRQYQVSELDTILFPLRPGEFEIAPSLLVLAETVFRDEQRLETNPVTVQVQPLPPGGPDDFNGAVGRFEMQAVLDHANAALGEPLRLRLAVTGSGNFEQLPPPELPVRDDWRVYQNPTSQSTGVTGGLLVGEKVFEWLIVPAATGTQTLPAITLSFFDPDSLSYRSVSTSPVMLEIFPAEEGASQRSPFLEDALSSPQAVLPLKPVPAVLPADDLYPGFAFWLLWLLPPAGAAASGWWAARRRRYQQDRVKIRQSKALRRAQSHLKTAENMRSNDACRVMSEAIYLYFGDKLNTVGTGLAQTDLLAAMDAHNIPDAQRAQVLNCLELADEGRYAPLGSVNAQSLLQRTLEALSAVDAHWSAE